MEINGPNVTRASAETGLNKGNVKITIFPQLVLNVMMNLAPAVAFHGVLIS